MSDSVFLSDFDFPLPPEAQIAQYPLKQRSESRLLCYSPEKNKVEHRQFHEILDFLSAGDLLVFNNTKVIPARLFGHKKTGGHVEILVERILDDKQFLAHVRTSKALKVGGRVYLETPHLTSGHSLPQGERGNIYVVEVISRKNDLFLLQLLGTDNIQDCLNCCGHMPLPPYIQREDILEDKTRYQTVYAEQEGAVAAPTAGLHFDESLLEKLSQKGIQKGFLTLHVGAGTFQPVRVSSIADHKMHSEYLEVDPLLCDQIMQTKKSGGKVIAVGTTVVRALETAARSGELKPYVGDTDIFITPGFKFSVIDGMITNFHWPRSTLLMLVSALIDREKLLAIYQEAIREGYRFFSYGDAMLIL